MTRTEGTGPEAVTWAMNWKWTRVCLDRECPVVLLTGYADTIRCPACDGETDGVGK